MYADLVETASKSSIKTRLNGGTLVNSGHRRQVTGKRINWEIILFYFNKLLSCFGQRQDDDKWEHDLYEHADPQVSNRRIGTLDLRLKLQKKNNQRVPVSGVRDLREKLSGISYSQSAVTAPTKPKTVSDANKPVKKSVITEAPQTKKVASSVSKRKKTETVDTFLQSLGIEKYLITFQAEEVDMTALLHMTDEDLKAIGIPMGPRKKILLALESKA